MAKESASFVGSGIQVLRHVNNFTAMIGSNAVIVNPEDINSALGVFQANSVEVGSVATNLTSGILPARRKVLIQNEGPSTVYIGGSSVTSTDGYPIDSGTSLELDILGFGSPYGITTSGSTQVRVLQLA